jgi:uncharacterized coiled-coil protein SlyX
LQQRQIEVHKKNNKSLQKRNDDLTDICKEQADIIDKLNEKIRNQSDVANRTQKHAGAIVGINNKKK